MPSTLLRLAVALLTFGLGVSATTFWIASRTPTVTTLEIAPEARIIGMPTVLEADAPPPPPAPPSQIMGGRFPGGLDIEKRALSKPAPTYPSVAVASQASGTVEVWVAVSENGRVVSARALSGHPLLREAAVDAAYEARFAPARLDGRAMKVSGVVNYNFVLP
ncbi:MAG TPA: energy transducer TonB [Pyrinomonadaceae bacterium]|nr:energy transducer TonB [Pyrinomonadaceae bacterium]